MIGWPALRMNSSDLGFAGPATCALNTDRDRDSKAAVHRRDAINFAMFPNRHPSAQSDRLTTPWIDANQPDFDQLRGHSPVVPEKNIRAAGLLLPAAGP